MRRGLMWVSGLGLNLASILACGGAIEPGSDDDVGGAGATSVGGTSAAGGALGTGGIGGTGGSGSGGKPFVEEECPDTEPPPPQLDCDPFDPFATCGAGYGCYASLEYPTEPCGHPHYVASCRAAGLGTQGEACDYLEDCQPGFMCVVGAGAGARCAQLCFLGQPDNCPHGLVCGETDVAQHGVCY